MSRLRLVCCLGDAGRRGRVPDGAAAARPAAPGPSVVVEEAEPWRSVASAARRGGARRPARPLGAGARGGPGGEPVAPDRRGRRAAGARTRGSPRAAPAPGSYRCRYVRLGGRKWTASAQGFCYVGVEAGQLSLATELRGLRLGGYLWELKGGERLVFLGAAVPAGSQGPRRPMATIRRGTRPGWSSGSANSATGSPCRSRRRAPASPSSSWSRRRGLAQKKAARRRPFRKAAAQQLPGLPSAQSVVDSTSFAAP